MPLLLDKELWIIDIEYGKCLILRKTKSRYIVGVVKIFCQEM